jgi:thiamine-monophosphate kinase
MDTETRRLGIVLETLRRYPTASAAGIEAIIGPMVLDDCAVLPFNSDYDLVVGSDFVRGEGFNLFKRNLLTRRDVGYYLVGANVSDLAAMGAAPLGVTVVYRYTETTSDESFREVMEGVVTACRDMQCPLLGGDTGAYETNVLSAAAIGLCPRGRALLRSRGQPGDRLLVTGNVGTAAAAVAYFNQMSRASRSRELEEELLAPWRTVSPAIAQGRFLVDSSLSVCGLDTSDGLLASCTILGRSSQCDVVLASTAIPVAESVRAVAHAMNWDILALALAVSVDFRLLFTAKPSDVVRLRSAFVSRGWPLFEIGELRQRASPILQVILSDGTHEQPATALTWSDLVPQHAAEKAV